MATDLPIDRPSDQESRGGGASLMARLLSTGGGLVVACVAVMWLIEITDSLLLSDRLQAHGIHPRELGGLDGVLSAPLLHSTFGHLMSNSVPFIVLGWLVAIRGVRYWLAVTATVVLLGGGLTWLLAGGGNHIGASGVVFGYFGALVGAAFIERHPAAVAVALVAILMYGTMLVGIVPQDRISWEGHLYGLIAGLAAGRLLARPRRSALPSAAEDADAPKFAWEADQPWLD